jgi:mono/diheme cytochrome c family protein
MRRACVLLAAAALVAAASSNLRADRPAAQSPAPAPSRPGTTASAVSPRATATVNQRQLVQQYCVTCHSERAKTGGLVLENLDPQNTAANADIWEKVVRKVRGGMMPPQGMPRPDGATLETFATSLDPPSISRRSASPARGTSRFIA